MKSVYLALFILLLVGCAAPTEQVEVVDTAIPAEDAVEDAIVEEEIAPPVEVVETQVLGTENIDILKDNIKINDYARILPSNTKLEAGDSYLFAHGITNPSLQTLNVQQRIEFVEAIDAYSNPIQKADIETITDWIASTKLVIFEVPSNEIVFREIQITVGDEMAPGVPTAKGTYKFKALLDDADKVAAGDPELIKISDFSVRVI